MTVSARFKLDPLSSRMDEPAPRSRASDAVSLGNREVSLTPGTGENQAQQHWYGEGTVGAGLNVDLDLTTLAGGAFGSTITLTRILVLFLEVAAPDGAKLLRVGPQGVTNGWKGWFGTVGADAWEELKQWLFRPNTLGATPGWPVTGTEKVFRLHNPGVAGVDYKILVVGV